MAYEKTWQFMSNSAFTPASAIDNARRTLWSLKAFLKGELGGATGAGVLWTHFGSSDGALLSECGAAGADRWTNAYNGALLVRAAAGVAHSWICLKSPVGAFGGQTFYLIIDYAHASSDQNASFYLSKAVPSVGTLTDRPTGTDEWSINGRTAGTVVLTDGSTAVHRIMAGINENGGCYFVVHKNTVGFAHFAFIMDELADPPAGAGDVYNIWAFVNYNATTPGALTLSALGQGGASGTSYGTCAMKRIDGTASYPAPILLFSIYHQVSPGPIPALSSTDLGKEEIDGEYLDLPCHVMHMSLASAATGSLYGYRGRLVDLSMGGETPQGSVRPASGSPEYFLVGSLWLPGDTAPTL